MAISAQFTADFTSWKASVDDARGDITKLTETTDKFAAVAVQKQAAEFGTKLRELGADVIRVGSQFVAAYAEEEQATASLAASLEAQGLAGKGVEEQYAALAAEMQRTTRFADDATTRSMTIFTTVGKLGPEQMKPALDAAANLAVYMKTDLPTAATIMAKAFGSGGDSLGKLKGLLGESGKDAKTFEEVLAAMNKQFGGQAQRDIESTAGATLRFKNQMGDAEEQVGGFLANAMQPLTQAFAGLPGPVQETLTQMYALAGPLGQVGGSALSVVSSFVPLVTLLVGPAGVSAALATVGSAIAAVALPVAATVAAIYAIYYAFQHWDEIKAWVEGVYNAVKTYMVDKLQAIIAPVSNTIKGVVAPFKAMYDAIIGHSYVPDLIAGIENQFGRLDAVMVAPAVAASAQTTAALAAAQAAAQGFGGAGLASPSGGFTAGALSTVTSGGGIAYDLYGRPVAPIAGLSKSMGSQNITVNVAGNVLSTEQQLATAVQGAMTESYKSTGYRWP